jgi:hypothetical protein
MAELFDNPPYGYDRARKKGWLKPAKGPLHKRVQRLKSENEDLRARLEAVEATAIDREDRLAAIEAALLETATATKPQKKGKSK